jgi:UDP-glucose 4-epimerase
LNNKKYILVTGGAGYIGSIVTSRLILENKKVIIIDNLSTGSKFLINKKAIFIKADITCYKSLIKQLKNYIIESIFHFAACLSVPESQKKPLKYYENNVIGTENLLKIAKNKKIKKFIFSSSCAVYGDLSKKKISENDLTLPVSNYGKTKLLAENLITNYSIKNKFKYAILRYFNVVGADIENNLGQIYGSSLFKELSKSIVNKKFRINLYGNNYLTKDKTCVRDYIDVNDLCDLHFQSYLKLNKKESFILNCGYNIGYSVKEIINQFSKQIQQKIKINAKPRREGDAEAIYCNNKKLKKIFPNWERKYNIKDSIRSAIKWEFTIKKIKNLF